MSLGQHIDKLFKLDVEIGKVEAMKAALEKKRKALEDQLLGKFKRQDLDGAIGRLGMMVVNKSEYPQIDDADKFYQYVLKKKAVDLLQRRVSVSAFRERLEAGEKVPGLKVYTKISLRVTKRR